MIARLDLAGQDALGIIFTDSENESSIDSQSFHEKKSGANIFVQDNVSGGTHKKELLSFLGGVDADFSTFFKRFNAILFGLEETHILILEPFFFSLQGLFVVKLFALLRKAHSKIANHSHTQPSRSLNFEFEFFASIFCAGSYFFGGPPPQPPAHLRSADSPVYESSESLVDIAHPSPIPCRPTPETPVPERLAPLCTTAAMGCFHSVIGSPKTPALSLADMLGPRTVQNMYFSRCVVARAELIPHS